MSVRVERHALVSTTRSLGFTSQPKEGPLEVSLSKGRTCDRRVNDNHAIDSATEADEVFPSDRACGTTLNTSPAKAESTQPGFPVIGSACNAPLFIDLVAIVKGQSELRKEIKSTNRE